MSFEEAPPPTYEASTSRQWLSQVAPYIGGRDLAQAVRVCKVWNQLLLPFLCGDPSAHFPSDAQAAQRAFLEFRQALSKNRFSTRSLTHTIRLSSAFSRADYRPSITWLRQVIEGLPELQSLVLSSTSFLDYEALAALSHRPGLESLHHLKLISLTSCQNVTTAGLLNLLAVPAELLYLDLSGTRAARDARVFARLGTFTGLKVLKVANIAMGDDLATNLFSAIGKKVYYLDIANNNLTDRSIETLAPLCLKEPLHPGRAPGYESRRPHQTYLASVEKADTVMYKLLTTSFSRESTIENLQIEGVQSLNISRNNISYTALLSLANSGLLQALDGGCCTARLHGRLQAQPLEPLSSRLTYLRVPHHLVTGLDATKRRPPEQIDFQPFLHTKLDSLERVEAERQNRIQEFRGDFIAPALHPKLKSLVMTNIPARSADDALSNAMIQLVRDCALEARLASLQARLDYRLAPDQRTTTSRLRREAKRLFALEEIVLEIAPPQNLGMASTSGWNHASDVKSMTGDVDSEVLWDAYSSDFSFFGNEQALDTKEKRSGQDRLLVDTVAEISTFRKKVKGQFEAALRHGDDMPKIDGFWDGYIKVLRT